MILYYLLSLIAGTVVTFQVVVNSQLRDKVGSPLLSSLISFAVGTLSLLLIYWIRVSRDTEVLPNYDQMRNLKIWMFAGGCFGAFYIFTTIVTAPKIGFANMFSLVICGQLILAVIVDSLGLFGNQVQELNPMKIFGVALLIAGVYIIQAN